MSADYTSDDELWRAYSHGSWVHVVRRNEDWGGWDEVGDFDRETVDQLDEILRELGK